MISSSTAIAISPTTASSFSPYRSSDCSSVWASTQVIIETTRPRPAPISTGRRRRRRAPTNEAVIAARISTASRPSRNTMIAELVTTVALLAESPSVAAASASFSSSTSRVSWTSRRGARSAISVGEARLADRAEPDQALDVGRQPGVERLQPPLGAELEERVRLEPRLLGLPVLLGADRGLQPVERERDQVVVGLVVRLLPRLGHRRREVVLDPLGERLDVVGRAHALGALRRLADDRRRARRAGPSTAAARRGSRLASWSCRSASAAAAPVRNATASWISKSSVTRVPLTPRPYSTGTSARKRSSCWARRADSSAVSGAAVKLSSPAAIAARAARNAGDVAGRAAPRRARRTRARARRRPACPRSSA